MKLLKRYLKQKQLIKKNLKKLLAKSKMEKKNLMLEKAISQ